MLWWTMVPFVCDMSFSFYICWINRAVISSNTLLNRLGHIAYIRIIMQLCRYLFLSRQIEIKTDYAVHCVFQDPAII